MINWNVKLVFLLFSWHTCHDLKEFVILLLQNIILHCSTFEIHHASSIVLPLYFYFRLVHFPSNIILLLHVLSVMGFVHLLINQEAFLYDYIKLLCYNSFTYVSLNETGLRLPAGSWSSSTSSSFTLIILLFN